MLWTRTNSLPWLAPESICPPKGGGVSPPAEPGLGQSVSSPNRCLGSQRPGVLQALMARGGSVGAGSAAPCRHCDAFVGSLGISGASLGAPGQEMQHPTPPLPFSCL